MSCTTRIIILVNRSSLSFIEEAPFLYPLLYEYLCIPYFSQCEIKEEIELIRPRLFSFLQVSVRTEAAVTLGKLEHVSDAFLDQTLDKKLMATLKVGMNLECKMKGGSEFQTDLDAPKRLQNSLFAISKHNPRMDGRQRPNRWSARDQNRRERQR